jgi:LCP family protein required for cell wall assembly
VTTSSPATPPRSAFAAAFLTFIVPGLGHAYAGAYRRALAFAILPMVVLAGLLIQLVRFGPLGLGLWIGQTSVLGPLAVGNIAALAYRVVATVDAYRCAFDSEPRPVDTLGWRRHVPHSNPLSLTGLAAVLIVMTAGHALAGYWDLRFLRALDEIHSPVVITAEASDAATSTDSAAPSPTPLLEPQSTFAAQPSLKPWDQKERLNILLVGVDQQDGGFRTDTMIVASIDPKTHRVALFSLPRDTQWLPTPPSFAALPKSLVAWPLYERKLNTMWERLDPYRGLFPHGGVDALKQAMSYALFGRTDAISYYVLVSFSGFQTIVDTLGGVTVNVPAPIVDNGYPGNGDGEHQRLYVRAGMQHFDGEQALAYARSRHCPNTYDCDDYNRSARQEAILVALEQQANLGLVSSHLSDLIDALSGSIHTDIPEGPEVLGALIDQARYINLTNIKSYAFNPDAGYGYDSFVPYLDRIQAAVAAATSPTAGLAPQPVLAESAPIAVDVGSGTAQQAADMVAYLQSLGLNAQLGDSPPTNDQTKLLVVNGADAQYPQTLALLEKTLGLSGPISSDGSTSVQAVSDPAQQIGFVIVLGPNAPNLTPPPPPPSPK